MGSDFLASIWPEWNTAGQIGNGPRSTVYEAVNGKIHSAVKVASISQVDIADGIVQGIEFALSLREHPNFVRVDDYKAIANADGTGCTVYTLMELLTPIGKYARENALSEPEVIKLGCDICSALEICAQYGVIHRDIKPENIFVDRYGNFKLSDFGYGSIPSASAFAAPEQGRGELAASTDIYSLGLVMYSLLNHGQLPSAPPTNEIQFAPPGNASFDLAQIILTACSYDPTRRFSSAAAMKNALLSISSPSPEAVSYQSQSSAYEIPEQRKKKHAIPKAVPISLAAVIVVGAAYYAVLHFSKDNDVGDDADNSAGIVVEESIDENNDLTAEGVESGAIFDDTPVDSAGADLVADGIVNLTGSVKISADEELFLKWDDPVSILLTDSDGSYVIANDVTTAYIINNGVSEEVWGLLPYDGSLTFFGTLRLEDSRLYMDVEDIAKEDGSALTADAVEPLDLIEPEEQPEKETSDNGASDGTAAPDGNVAVDSASNSAIASVTSSSHLEEYYADTGYLHHIAENVIDGSDSTAWIEGVSGDGVGEWIQLDLDGEYVLNGLEIENGYWKSAELYSKNGRVKSLRLTFSDGSSQTFSLNDEFGVLQTIALDAPVVTSSIKIEILEVYPGNKYDDTCITWLNLF